ncbi:hypothetical protein HG536_0F03890 [Torulaspora globosa]|uniref:CCR4-Not complex 3'-5'-exoribonuclease subunit Ccr4 n=1 Tax=Torulaspora globosa TaxID=48254 RepID=A0A7G3ZKM8_9SACH|nr:uncharacterized protein HG536_0F03890 [Torulaspora globosa]QLL34064.1 hypothetical protein HG536_0F03890 [Torulaspora globosa]
MNNPSILSYPSLGPQHQPNIIPGMQAGTPTGIHQQLQGNPLLGGTSGGGGTMPPPGMMKPNIGGANDGAALQLLNHLGTGSGKVAGTNSGTVTGSVNGNEKNPLYHLHLEEPGLLNNPIWKLQLQLAAVSAQSMGQPNVYARQNAMKKYLVNQQQQQQSLDHQRQPGLLQQVSGSQTQLQTTEQQPQNPQMAVASVSLVDKTKQLLMEMAADIKDTAASSNNGISNPPGSANTSATANTSGSASSPSTPKTELHNLRDQNTGTPVLLLQHKKLSQFNIDEDDELEHRMAGPKNTKFDDQLWHAIDFSNLQIFNISANLFKYTFLTRLYLNGNSLTSIPPAIKSLVNLRVLDLSHNKLTSLPKEMGHCYQLKYLYVFDNMITTLPWEFGSLFNLQFLGCEGNPLDKQLLKILTEKSVTGLIFYLRDNRPEVPMTKDRDFIEINADGDPVEKYKSLQEADEHLSRDLAKRSFTVLSYNTLCQHYATPKMYRYTPSWALSWDYRREKLTEQILSYMSDVICLQEVEAKTFEDYWAPLMQKHGYSGLFHAKTRAKTMHSKDSKKVDGCCVFYKKSEFRVIFKDAVDFSGVWMKHKKFQRTEDYLNRAMNKDNVAIYLKLEHIESGEHVWLVTTHLHWDPQFNDVKTFQVGVLMDHMEDLLREQSNAQSKQEIKKCSVILCGDLNSEIDSAVYELLSTGRVQTHDDVKGRDFGYMTQKNFAHNLSMKSSYSHIGELPLTNFTPSFTSVIDYIWFSTQSLRVRGLLGPIDSDYISEFIGFPNAKFPSDHIPILARFEFVKGGAGSSRKI